jgi:transposase
MKTFLSIICLSLFANISYAGDGANQQEEMKAQLQKLIKLDEQIENLEKQKLQEKAEVAKHLERGSTGILPGVGRRQSREAEEGMQNVKNLNQKIEQLNQERSEVISALK